MKRDKIESNAFKTTDFSDINAIISNCLFRWLITKSHGSAIELEKDSFSLETLESHYIGCISQNTDYSGAISIISQSGNVILNKLSFLSCFGGKSSAIYFDAKSNGYTEFNSTIMSGCYQVYNSFYILQTHLISTSYNASFCVSTDINVYSAIDIPSSYCSYYIFYKNPTIIEWGMCSPSSDNYLYHSAFIENDPKSQSYGVVHTNNQQQETFVDDIVFYGNTYSLFNPANGKIYASNIICDTFSTNGNNIVINSPIISGFSSIFPSPINNINTLINNVYINQQNTISFHSYLPLFLTFLS